MKHETFGWHSAGNTPIFARIWQPANASVIGSVCLIHGLGEHSSRYTHVAHALSKIGLATLTFDHYGHGQSGGKRGHIPSYNAYLDDIARLLTEARQRVAHRPIFLYGHSLGGNLVLNYALRRQPELAGIIASSPWLKLTHPPPVAHIKMAQLTNRITPSFTLRTDVRPEAISRDPVSVTTYATDPLIHNRCSVRLFTECYQAGLWALEHAPQFSLPLLIFHGSADQITCPQASRQFADAVSGDCTFKLWDNLYHETHNEPEKHEVLQFVTRWLLEHLLA